ncbi:MULTISPECIES: FecR family protein [Rhizobium/Agrobacterium group]|uniref:FecR family protein n=1 Tax=Rhizobium/Agrobacterium group TaxID=227290 RepID=UPI00107F2041|nr:MULTISPECIES: FecR domain-containing protein [Rhizobium/Agrobacterium group]MBB4403677.1 transmembrane sensor [Agrobacterium radiobacter]MBB5589830.1 transmembrane sensor [Agrobacterium radiobacter]TGE87348.1 iron dicitrate transport regulator FecR [Rhizobium sp. SEMIA 4032]
MNEVSEERRLFREAADIAIRLQNDPGNPVAIETARAWIERGPAHAAAWAKVAAIHGMTGQILAEEAHSSQKGFDPNRRLLLVGGVLCLGAAAGGSVLAPYVRLRARADYLTSTAEIREIPLEDGSMVTLGPDSAIAVDFGERARRVNLLTGMAYFDVRPDASRPFSVAYGPLTATALGTAFDVSGDDLSISVSVDHGLVLATSPDLPSPGGEKLAAGEWLTYDQASRRMDRGVREAFEIAAWRTGMLIAEKETVAAVVNRIARWQKGKVVIATPALKNNVVSGVFDLADPIRALDAVVRPFGGKVRAVTPFLTVISSI